MTITNEHRNIKTSKHFKQDIGTKKKGSKNRKFVLFVDTSATDKNFNYFCVSKTKKKIGF